MKGVLIFEYIVPARNIVNDRSRNSILNFYCLHQGPSTRILSYKKQLIRNTSGISGNHKKQALVNPKTLRNIALVKMAVRNICSFSNSHLMQHDLNSSWFLECIY